MRFLIAVAVCLLSGSSAHGQAPSSATNQAAVHDVRDRRDFAKVMAGVKEGMSREHVVTLLGQPDDVREVNISSARGGSGIREVLAYGTNGRGTLPTLGKVAIDEAGKVSWVAGGLDRDNPPEPSQFREEQLREILRTLDRVPSPNAGLQYNPLRVIQAVNQLQPLGKQRALAAVQEYLRVGGNGDSMFCVLLTLFDVPKEPGYLPWPALGGPIPEPVDDRAQIPRFPILLQDDIPFLGTYGYALAGVPEQPDRRLIPYLREHGVLRDTPLSPTSRPAASIERILQIYPWKDRRDVIMARTRQLLLTQTLRMLESVYHVEMGESGYLEDRSPESHDRILEDLDRLKIRWDAKRMIYMF